VRRIRAYYGEEVALYFAWMNHFTCWLVLPAIAGLTYYTATKAAGLSVENNAYTPLFSFSIVVWATLFNKSWTRKSNAWALEWGTYFEQAEEEVRPAFVGKVRVSPVTGLPDRFYPKWKRILKYGVSVLVTLGMLCIAFAAMICSLNLQGYIRDGHFHVPTLSQFSDVGQPFNQETGNFIVCLVPTICHVITIQVLNQLIYRRIARWLTDWENHRTEASHVNSLILKRFFFEAFDCYISLFYLAFYELDVMKVRSELVALYTADCVRRLATETILPLVVQWATRRMHRKKLDELKQQLGEKVHLSQAVQDAGLDEYEQFDDYLEMVIEFGYITMFGSAFPLGAALSLLYNLVEMQNDRFKLTYAVQRPRSCRVNCIGTWQTVLLVQTIVAAFTNVAIFGFASNQMEQWMPQWFVPDGGSLMKPGMEGNVVGSVFFIEHVLLIVIALVMWRVPDLDAATKLIIQKRLYEEEQAFQNSKRMEQQDFALKCGGDDPQSQTEHARLSSGDIGGPSTHTMVSEPVRYRRFRTSSMK